MPCAPRHPSPSGSAGSRPAIRTRPRSCGSATSAASSVWHARSSAPRRAADEEDVALSAFDSFCRGAEQGCFPQLHDRLDLWQLLVLLTARKAFDLAQHERRQKRGGGAVLDEAALPRPADSSTQGAALEQIEGPEPTPAFAAQVAEECRRLLERLDSPELRSVALRKMEGYSNEEIAAQLGCGLRTVERRLRLIRSIWEQEGVS
jgi:hypothetical protein